MNSRLELMHEQVPMEQWAWQGWVEVYNHGRLYNAYYTTSFPACDKVFSNPEDALAYKDNPENAKDFVFSGILDKNEMFKGFILHRRVLNASVRYRVWDAEKEKKNLTSGESGVY